MAEVAAERDQLFRAELAVDARKVERKLEALAAQHATDLAELGRRADRVADLERELAERSSALAETIATLAETRSKLEITSEILDRTATELHDTGATLSTRDAELSDLQDAHFGLRAQSEERRLMIASLETSVEGLRARVSDLERQTSMLRTTLEDRDRRIVEFDTDKSLLEHRISGLQQDREDRDKQLEALRAERAAIVAKLTHALEQASSIEAQHEAETMPPNWRAGWTCPSARGAKRSTSLRRSWKCCALKRRRPKGRCFQPAPSARHCGGDREASTCRCGERVGSRRDRRGPARRDGAVGRRWRLDHGWRKVRSGSFRRQAIAADHEPDTCLDRVWRPSCPKLKFADPFATSMSQMD